MSPPPQLGDRVVLLDGHRCGMVGTVSNIKPDPALGYGTFLIRADEDDPRYEQIVNPSLALYGKCSDLPDLPIWFLPFSLRDCVDLHEVFVQFVDRCFRTGEWKWDRSSFNEVIRFCWSKRLPLQPDEMWENINAHGVPTSYEAEAMRAFSEGMELLVYANGRAPIKKKRLKRNTAKPAI